MVDAYDIPVHLLARWKAGHVDERGRLTRAGALAQAESGFRWARHHAKVMRDHRELRRDYVRRAWYWRQEMRRLRDVRT